MRTRRTAFAVALLLGVALGIGATIAFVSLAPSVVAGEKP
jgi:hypothetical protein